MVIKLKDFDKTKTLKEQGIVRKYNVERVDGQNSDPNSKHYKKDYFVLDYIDDPHARQALFAYAASCQKDYPILWEEILDLLADTYK